MSDPNFLAGESGDDGPTPVFETQGARYNISVVRPQRGVQEHLSDPYLIPSVHYRRGGNMEKTTPSIVQTPLGGMVPGPDAIAPALPIHGVGAQQDPRESMGLFGQGVMDGWPEGAPVPLR